MSEALQNFSRGTADSLSPVAVIGAGLAGIACARTLAAAGLDTIIFEKSRSYGGRCATRLWNGRIVDHGAQYFTATDADFSSAIQKTGGADILALAGPILDRSGLPLPQATRPRFYHRQGNNRLARALADGLDVRREHTLRGLGVRPDGAWTLEFEEGTSFVARHVVLTCPWPQTAALLGLLASCDFQPCLTGLFAYSGAPDGAAAARYAVLGDREEVLAWSACENHKQGRIPGDVSVFVVQSGSAFSGEFLENPAEDWLARQQMALESTWEISRSRFLESFGHRWRFARNLATIDKSAPVALPPGISIAGDSTVDSRVESAWLSGRNCALQILGTTARSC